MSDPMTDRLPPHSREAEEGVIGGIMRDPDVLDAVQHVIRADNFYFDAHQKVFQAIADLRGENQPIDLVLVHERLRKNKQLDDVGGPKFLADLWERVPTGANAEYHAKIVRDNAMIRSLIHAGNEVLRDAYDRTQSADEMIAQAERKVMDIARAGMIGETKTLGEVVREAFDRIDSRVGKENLAISGIPTGYVDLDHYTAGLQNSELVIVAARPSVGKCVTADTEVVAADGSVSTIEEVFRRGRGSVLSLAADWTIGPAAPSAFVDDGLKPVFRVTTQLGRVIETTASHPFRTLAGWVPLARLAAGDHVAVPRRIPAFGAEPMRECEPTLLGYLIGDGGLSDTCPEFTSANPRVRAEFEAAVREFGGLAVRTEDSAGTRTPTVCVSSDPAAVAAGRGDFGRRLGAKLGRGGSRVLAAAVGVSPASVTHWRQGKTAPDPETFGRVCAALRVGPADLAPDGVAGIRKNGKNALTLWLDSLGLWGKTARDKFVPAAVFRLPRPQLARFLNRLFATDGWATVTRDGSPRVGFGTVSERLARQVQHLLLRFGVVARLRYKPVKYRGTRRDSWQLDVVGPDSVRAFAADIGMFGKEAALERAVAALAGRGRKACKDVIPAAVWDQLAAAKGDDPWAAVAARAGYPDGTNLHVGTRAMSRRRLARLAAAVGSGSLRQLAAGDVYWDRIVSIEPTGVKPVYDLTVPGTHNFVANDVCVHNTAFALNLVRHMITEEQASVLFFSLEMARVELAERLLACQSRVDSHKIRTGHLSSDDIQKLMDAGDVLRKARLYIDDTPTRSMLQIAATARRLMKKEEKNGGLKAIMIDYLQLIEPESRRDPRQEQVAQISRRLKILARDLKVPVVALAQVNRGSEDRQDHKPRLSDLRESGCLTADTLVPMADTGERVRLGSLVGRSGFRVWALDEGTLKLTPATVSRAFSTGVKPVYRLETRLGRTIRATANHPFLRFGGWTRLDALTAGDRIALPRTWAGPTGPAAMAPDAAALLGHLIGDGCTLPRHAIQYTTADRDLADEVAGLASRVFPSRVVPRVHAERDWYQVYLTAADRLTHGVRNPVAAWLDDLGVFGLRSWEKYVPEAVFRQPDPVVARFLRHLWATDGCVRAPTGRTRHPAVYYASSSERLARDVQSLLLRLGINAVLRPRDQGGNGRTRFHVLVMGRDDLLAFADRVGAVGSRKSAALTECRDWLAGRAANTNRDVIPAAVWDAQVRPTMARNKVSMRAMQAAMGMSFAGTTLYKSAVGRGRLARVAEAVGGDDRLRALAGSDVYWDEVVSVNPDGEAEVFDLTVPGPHNFVADGFIVHNSIEQDADTVLMLHRPAMYDKSDQNLENVLEIIIAKQRNGPTGEVTLTYLKQYMRYENYIADVGYGGM